MNPNKIIIFIRTGLVHINIESDYPSLDYLFMSLCGIEGHEYIYDMIYTYGPDTVMCLYNSRYRGTIFCRKCFNSPHMMYHVCRPAFNNMKFWLETV